MRTENINALTTDLDLDIPEEDVTEPVEPPETSVSWDNNIWEAHLEVGAVNKITIPADGGSDLAAPISSAVKHLLNCLHTEVGMASVDHFEKSDLWVTSSWYLLSFPRSLDYILSSYEPISI